MKLHERYHTLLVPTLSSWTPEALLEGMVIQNLPAKEGDVLEALPLGFAGEISTTYLSCATRRDLGEMRGQAVGEANVAPPCPALGASGTWLSDWILGKGWRFAGPECWAEAPTNPRVSAVVCLSADPHEAMASCGQLLRSAPCGNSEPETQ